MRTLNSLCLLNDNRSGENVHALYWARLLLFRLRCWPVVTHSNQINDMLDKADHAIIMGRDSLDKLPLMEWPGFIDLVQSAIVPIGPITSTPIFDDINPARFEAREQDFKCALGQNPNVASIVDNYIYTISEIFISNTRHKFIAGLIALEKIYVSIPIQINGTKVMVYSYYLGITKVFSKYFCAFAIEHADLKEADFFIPEWLKEGFVDIVAENALGSLTGAVEQCGSDFWKCVGHSSLFTNLSNPMRLAS